MSDLFLTYNIHTTTFIKVSTFLKEPYMNACMHAKPISFIKMHHMIQSKKKASALHLLSDCSLSESRMSDQVNQKKAWRVAHWGHKLCRRKPIAQFFKQKSSWASKFMLYFTKQVCRLGHEDFCLKNWANVVLSVGSAIIGLSPGKVCT
jgi:hypothetical protein